MSWSWMSRQIILIFVIYQWLQSRSIHIREQCLWSVTISDLSISYLVSRRSIYEDMYHNDKQIFHINHTCDIQTRNIMISYQIIRLYSQKAWFFFNLSYKELLYNFFSMNTLSVVDSAVLVGYRNSFLPVLYGILLLIVAFIVSGIVKSLIIKVLRKVGLDQKLSQYSHWNTISLVSPIGELVYWFVFLLFLPTILSLLWLSTLMAPIQNIISSILGYIPNIISAVITFWVFYILASIVKALIEGFLGWAVDDMLSRFIPLKKPSSMIANWVFALLILSGLTQAVQALNLPVLTEALNNILFLVWNILVGLLFVWVWLFLSDYISWLMKTNGIRDWFVKVAQFVIVLLFSMMWLQRMWVGSEIINIFFTAFVGMIAVWWAIAIWLWAKDKVWEVVSEQLDNLR